MLVPLHGVRLNAIWEVLFAVSQLTAEGEEPAGKWSMVRWCPSFTREQRVLLRGTAGVGSATRVTESPGSSIDSEVSLH
jgi:hypothetical protein